MSKNKPTQAPVQLTTARMSTICLDHGKPELALWLALDALQETPTIPQPTLATLLNAAIDSPYWRLGRSSATAMRLVRDYALMHADQPALVAAGKWYASQCRISSPWGDHQLFQSVVGDLHDRLPSEITEQGWDILLATAVEVGRQTAPELSCDSIYSDILHTLAAYTGVLPMIERLLAAGANVDYRRDENLTQTPYTRAIIQGQEENALAMAYLQEPTNLDALSAHKRDHMTVHARVLHKARTMRRESVAKESSTILKVRSGHRPGGL